MKTHISATRQPASGSVALQHLPGEDLHYQVQNSLTELSILGRKAAAEIRVRLLPLLDEAKRRYDAGETINKIEGWHGYLRSLGLKPGTIRSWKSRKNERERIGNQEEVDRRAKRYEQKLHETLTDAVWLAANDAELERDQREYQERLENDEQFRKQHEQRKAEFKQFAERAAEEAKQGQRNLEETRINNVIVRFFMKLIIKEGRRVLAVKYHPDKGGKPDDMVAINAAEQRLTKFTEDDNQILSY